MPINRTFRSSPSLGPGLTDHQTHYWFDPDPVDVSYKLGNVEKGTDGRDYVMVKASAAIASTPTTGTQVTITEPGFTAATGAGGWFTPPGVAVAINEYFQARRTAL